MDRNAQLATTWDEQLDALGHGDKWEKRFKALAKQGRASVGELDSLLEGLSLARIEPEPLPSRSVAPAASSAPAAPFEPAGMSTAPQLYAAPPESWFPLSDALEPESEPALVNAPVTEPSPAPDMDAGAVSVSHPAPVAEALVPVSDVPTAVAVVSEPPQDDEGDLAELLEPESEPAPPEAALDAQRTTLIEDPDAAQEADRSYDAFLKSLEIPSGSAPPAPVTDAFADADQTEIGEGEPSVSPKPAASAPFRVAPPPPPPPYPSGSPGNPAPSAVPWPLEALATQLEPEESLSQAPDFDGEQEQTDFGTDFDEDSHDEFHTKVATSDSIMAALKKVAEEHGAAKNSILLRSIAPEPTAEAEVEEVFLLDEDLEGGADQDNLTDVEAQAAQTSGWPDVTQSDDPDAEKTESDVEAEPAKKGFFKRLFKSKD